MAIIKKDRLYCLLFFKMLYLFLIITMIGSEIKVSHAVASRETECPQLIQEAVQSYRDGKYAECIKRLKKYIAGHNHKDSWLRRTYVVMALSFEQIDAAKALPYWDYISRNRSVLSDYALFRKARLLEQLNMKREALANYEKLIKAFPDSSYIARCQQPQVRLNLDLDNFKAARMLLEQGILKDDIPQEKLLWAQCFIGLRQFEQARPILGQLILDFPLTSEARAAEKLLSTWSEHGAMDELNLSLNDHTKRLRLFLDNDFYGPAYSETETMLKKHEKEIQREPGILVLCARSFYHRKEYDQAGHLLEQINHKSDSPEMPEILSLLARIAWKKNESVQAISLFRTVQARWPFHPMTAHLALFLAGWLEEDARFSDALSLLNMIDLSSLPEDIRETCLWKKAWFLYLTKHYYLASSYLNMLVSEYTRSVEAHKYRYWLGKTRLAMNEIQSACDQLESIQQTSLGGYYSLRSQYLIERFCAQNHNERIPLSDWTCSRIGQALMPVSFDNLVSTDFWQRSLEFEQIGLYFEAASELHSLSEQLPECIFLQWKQAEHYYLAQDYNRSIPLFRNIYSYLEQRHHAFSSTELQSRIYPLDYHQLIMAEATRNSLEPSLIAALILQESSFRDQVRSPAGALGLMQIMPKVGKWLASRAHMKQYRKSWLLNADTNIKLGTDMVRWLDDLFNHDQIAVIAAYNAGRGRVLQWQQRFQTEDNDVFIELIPFAETQLFVKLVMRNQEHYRTLHGL
ncbi:transglycosylase SLT domain-containing protein [bacterium]|nr:transglycosylase SLT domain-containing protein [bacterium]